MKDEIKEILNNDIPIFVIDSDGYTIDITETIQNVITNLQQEKDCLQRNYDDNEQAIQKLIKELKELQQENENTKKLKERYQLEKEIYKSRFEKATEYIEERKNLNWYADGVFVDELLNILGGDEE